MRLRLRIGRQHGKVSESEEGGGSSVEHASEEPRGLKGLKAPQEPQAAASAAASAQVPQVAPAAASAQVPSPRKPDMHVVRAGSFCRLSNVGQTAVTPSGRIVVAIPAAHCARWVYEERVRESQVRVELAAAR